MAGMKLRTNGLEELARLPRRLERAAHELARAVAEDTADEIRRRAPGGRRGPAATAVVVERTGAGPRYRVRSRSFPVARVLEEGGEVRPRRGKALRFKRDGEVVFAARAQVPASHYHREGVAAAARKAPRRYAQVFEELDG